MKEKSAGATGIRWWTLAGLCGFSFVSYLERSNISVAAELMIPALHISQVQMGQIFTAFLIGYALFQIPGGFLGDKLGPRATLAGSALIWCVVTVLTGLLPALLGGTLTVIFIALWLIRFTLGIAEATTFPVGNRVVRNWMQPKERAFGSSLMMMGTCAASAVTSPLVSWLMLRFGWKASFYFTSVPALLIAVLWYQFARDTPQAHPAVDALELAHIQSGTDQSTSAAEHVPFLQLLKRRNVYLLVLSYLSEGYVLFIFVFWLYIYLVEKRGFSMIRGGWIAALPWLTALVMAPLGGLACDRLGAKYGMLRGAKVIVMVGYGLSGLLLFLAAYSSTLWVCVVSLSLSVGFLLGAESPFWSSATHLGGAHVGALSGVMNAAGVLGGVVSTSLVPVLVQHFGWLSAFASGTVMGLFSVCIWALIGEQSSKEATER